MKKNISINLQGMIFHIEEDGYEQLSQYLAAIKSYFSAYEGHEEITADIEARIAEIFYAKLSPTKQVITRDDVQALIAQMGSVKDFQVMEDEDETQAKSTGYGETYQGYNSTAGSYTNATNPEQKRIYRNVNGKVLGGVASGIATYLNMDPLWVRLGFVLLTFLFALPGGFPAGIIIIGYILCWIAFPKSYEAAATPTKKLFRNPFDKKLGGVCSGIALFFGTDVAVIRLLFLLSFILGGFGLLAYLVLWIIVPEASSVTDRMQMEGNPVTLSGFEESLKNNLRMKDENGQESTLARVILFPVRLVAQVIQFLARVLGPVLNFLISIIRIIAGALLVLVAGAFIFTLFVMAFTALNVVDGSALINFGDMPFSLLVNSFPQFGLVAGFFTALLPTLLLFILGLGLLLKRLYLRPAVSWSLFGIWILSLFTLILAIVDFRNDFRESGEYVEQKSFPVTPYQTVVLKARDTNYVRHGRAYFEIESYSGSDIRLVQTFRARGLTESDAIKNARMITYRSLQQDSVLTFDYNFKFNNNAIFREQRVDLKLLMPANKKFRISESMASMLSASDFEDNYNNYSNEEIAERTWQVKNSKFVCLDCPAIDTTTQNNSTEETSESDSDTDYSLDSPIMDQEEYGDEVKTFNLSGFSQVTASGIYHVKIRKGERFSVQAQGEGRLFDNLQIEQNGDELEIHSRRDMFNFSFRNTDPVLVTVVMPELRHLDLSGAVKVDAAGFNTNEFKLSESGAVEAVLHINSRELTIDATGACHTRLAGTGETLTVKGTGASEIKANRYKAANAIVDLSGASNARVYATNLVKADVSGASNVIYAGNPKHVDKNQSGMGDIEQE